MAVNKVEIYVSQVLEDLNSGLTWLKKDDLGYGSIQEKYNAKDQQIAIIRKHPKLKDAETSIIIFSIIDDTDDRNTTVSTDGPSNEGNVEHLSESSETTSTVPVIVSGNSDERDEFVHAETADNEPAETADDEFAAFANL